MRIPEQGLGSVSEPERGLVGVNAVTGYRRLSPFVMRYRQVQRG